MDGVIRDKEDKCLWPWKAKRDKAGCWNEPNWSLKLKGKGNLGDSLFGPTLLTLRELDVAIMWLLLVPLGAVWFHELRYTVGLQFSTILASLGLSNQENNVYGKISRMRI